jgi:hypothetical protein
VAKRRYEDNSSQPQLLLVPATIRELAAAFRLTHTQLAGYLVGFSNGNWELT